MLPGHIITTNVSEFFRLEGSNNDNANAVIVYVVFIQGYLNQTEEAETLDRENIGGYENRDVYLSRMTCPACCVISTMVIR